MEIVTLRHQKFIKALQSLNQALLKFKTHADHDMARDSVIQRFEYCADMFWKVLKDHLKMHLKIEVEIARPKPVFKECFDTKLISNEEFDLCIKLTEDRNLTSHAYDEEFAETMSLRIENYYILIQSVMQRITEQNKISNL